MVSKPTHYVIPPLTYMNVRASPTTKSSIISTVDIGAPVIMTGESRGGWNGVQLSNGRLGWISNSGNVFRRIDWSASADGYDQPVGTLEERRGAKVWGGSWYDASPYGRLYFVGTAREAYHTGADLNLPKDADYKMGLFAAASGVVLHARKFPTWGWMIVIRHDPLPNGRVFWTRYAHMESVPAWLRTGTRVNRGDEIGRIGTADGLYSAHLHFDVARTPVLETSPGDWSGRSLARVTRDYVDPKLHISANRAPLGGLISTQLALW